MAICGLDSDLTRENACESPVAGTKDLGGLINYNDVKGWKKQTTPLLPTTGKFQKVFNMPDMKFTKRAYKIEGKNNSIQLNDNLNGTGMFNQFTHALNFQVLGDSAFLAKAIEELSAGKFVGVVATKNQNIKIIGKVGGLVVQTVVLDSSSQDNGGTYKIESLSTDEPGLCDFMETYTGTSPNFVIDQNLTNANFQSLFEAQPYPITGITIGTTTRIDLDAATLPYVNEAKVGDLVTFNGIVGTVGTDAIDGLNGKTFAISAIIDSNTFEIAQDTTGLVYTSGGTAK